VWNKDGGDLEYSSLFITADWTNGMGPLDENRVAQLYAFPYSIG
jgi:hypothetical protein